MQPQSQYFNNSIFWIEIEKIVPNPYQPRRDFDQNALKDLSESIRMYGLLQPIVVTRTEIVKDDGGLAVQYELISGERRLRASKLAGLSQLPVIIRSGDDDNRVKLELAIIENLQREDLNAVDRARAFQQLADEFGLKHVQIAQKVGKSREYVSNTIRLLALPEHMLKALSEKKISEGHTRPLLMLTDRPEEQEVLFKEIIIKKITVREAERIARSVATERVRRKDPLAPDPEITEIEGKLNEALGTRVQIERKEVGGKVVIDFFNNDDLHHLLQLLEGSEKMQGFSQKLKSELAKTAVADAIAAVQAPSATSIANPITDPVTQDAPIAYSAPASYIAPVSPIENVAPVEVPAYNQLQQTEAPHTEVPQAEIQSKENIEQNQESQIVTDLIKDETDVGVTESGAPIDDSSPADAGEDDEDLYSIKNFSL
ncbi:MAG: ParB/RepB/Spo0J family partition protein [bacterium]